MLELAQCSLWDVLHAQDTEIAGADGGIDAAAAGIPGAPLVAAAVDLEQGQEHGQGQEQGEGQEQLPLRAMTLQRQLSLAREAATAVEFLHAQEPPIAHCDLKSANYLLGQFSTFQNPDFLFQNPDFRLIS